MNLDQLYCVGVTDRSEEAFATAELLESLGCAFSTYESREKVENYHTLYFETPAEAEAARLRIAGLRALWRECGAEVDEPVCFELAKEDWAEAWKKYFHTIHVSERLLVCPSWLVEEARPGQVVVEIDPGMCFGTGQHATTNFCLRMIDKYADANRGASFLDAGCGSGILSIAAAKLGFGVIDAFDYDPDAMAVSRENFAVNGLAPGRVALATADAADYRGRGEYDFVAANILGHLLLAYRKNISARVRDGGLLALSGILAAEYAPVRDAFVALGFDEIENGIDKGWTGGLFRKQNHGAGIQ